MRSTPRPTVTVFKGDVWSFTVEPYAYPITKVTATASSSQAGMGPEKTVDGSGLNALDQHSTEAKDMWLSAGAQPNWIQYEFDKAYKLHELWVWNSNQLIEAFVGFGAKNVTIEYSLDGTHLDRAGRRAGVRPGHRPGHLHPQYDRQSRRRVGQVRQADDQQPPGAACRRPA